MKKTKLIIGLFLLTILLVPLVSAVWWNPFTWVWFQNYIYNPDEKIEGIVDIQECNNIYEIKKITNIEKVWQNESWIWNTYYTEERGELIDTVCKNIGVNINNEDKIMFDDYYCSHSDDKTLICDSKGDGNGDGICQSGESCFKIIVNKDKTLTRTKKNSRDDFIENDNTFVLKKKIYIEKLG